MKATITGDRFVFIIAHDVFYKPRLADKNVIDQYILLPQL